MTKKEQKYYEDLKVLEKLCSDYNIRLRIHLHERENLQKEHDWLVKKINKVLEKEQRNEGKNREAD